MSNSNFIDYVKLYCRSGNGGPGARHFRREKFVPLGGPDGGDGGHGGSIILRGNAQLWTLLHLKYTKHIKAENGKGGEGARRTGASGKDVILEVPMGTVAKNGETGDVYCEITQDGQEVVLLKGGRGGLGNSNFTTSTNQAPEYAQPGEPGIETTIVLELKVLADVGLVGFPNAGKSTLLAAMTAAKPKIADYPFTTIVPNLGVVAYRDYKSFVMADIPGIIEGAAEGKGLGHRFLRHIERNSVLLFLIPADSEDIAHEYQILINELEEYNPELLDKRRLLAISKGDLLDTEATQDLAKRIPKGLDWLLISAVSGYHLDTLRDRLWDLINRVD